MPYKDTIKQKKAQHESYLRNKLRVIERSNVKRSKIRKYIQDIKEENPCMDCGVQYAYYVMHLDHCRGIKNSPVSRLVREGRSLILIKREIEKCDLVCANCHAIRTFERMYPN